MSVRESKAEDEAIYAYHLQAFPFTYFHGWLPAP